MRSAVITALLATLFLSAGSAIAAPGTTITPGSQGASVRGIQLALSALGYLPSGRTAVSGSYDEATVFAVEAFQKQEGISRDGVAGPQTLKLLSSKKTARPIARYRGKGRHIEISIGHQLLYLVANGVVTRTIAVSTARPGHVTPTGHFSVYRKETLSWSIPYQSWMAYASYFYGGYAIHGYPDVPVYPASHGCVRVPEVFMREVYSFAAYKTPVYIYS